MTKPKTALEGIRVLDLGRYQAGPRAGLVLARLGAEVIKVEALTGDESRGLGGRGSIRGQSGYWVQYNSGKKSLAIDLRKEQAKAILRDLVKVSDVLIQNFRPGTIAEMGFSYEALHDLNPSIIMLNVSAYGQYGPYRDRVGFDPIGQAMCGLMQLTGYPDTPPTATAMPVIDRVTALHGTIGVLAALHERSLSGEGQEIDVSLADTGFSLTEIPIVNYLGNKTIPERQGNRNPGSMMNTYETQDGWALIIAPSQNIWPRLAQCLGRPEWLEDERFSSRGRRMGNAGVIEQELAAWFAARTTEDAVNTLSEAGVPCAPVNDVPQAAGSPQLWDRELLVEVPDAVSGTIHVSGKQIKLSRTDMVVGSAPTVGQHTDEVLSDLLGYSADQIGRLRDQDVVR
jgi:crotonobetainyl-CoA:carnitine CoA-transferase CaiB-like acyl-CoA transferase